MSALHVLTAENKLAELANQICCTAPGTTGAVIGSTIVGEDGVRPIDRIADRLRTETDTPRAVAEVEAVVAPGQREVFSPGVFSETAAGTHIKLKGFEGGDGERT
ncbi:hypothetical protein HOY82DRAFT_606992 [Tuber indicum]|nr:hypothetical protein HOY82DRAFT_606992 [Tuber indicum]